MVVVLLVNKFLRHLHLNRKLKVSLINYLVLFNRTCILDEEPIPVKEELPTTLSCPSQSQSSIVIHFANVNFIFS